MTDTCTADAGRRPYRVSAVERLLNILRGPNVCRPEAIHEHACRYWREGKSHGPCTCGARELDAQLRQALIDCGVPIGESPNQVRERTITCSHPGVRSK